MEDVEKYYTPNISEFHVGFEYESNYNKSNLKDWEKKILSIEDADSFFESYKYDAVQNEFRVKYLDREDIESLGFEYNHESTEFTYYYKDSLDKMLSQRNEDPTQVSVYMKKWVEKPIFFIIKNKSELKRLLIQLKMLEDGEN